ncbi:MAG: putative DNA binding domain-containing protein [Bifidobacteriaceae bacterium]|jgi:ATP-dependent DNA helicase RecG|nr:putative DNA binding domain-containing protein [Bifidobacteriaceae bacterium]
MDIVKLVTALRSEGSDTEATEAKLASGGLPDDLAPVLSAFANRPGGGTLILGLNEQAGFAAVGVYDPKKAQQALANLARQAVFPPVQLSTEIVVFEGATLVVAEVKESSPADKPVSVARSGLAYLRQYDGTFPLSEMERQVLLAARGPSEAELRAVDGTTAADFDGEALAQFIRQRRSNSPVFAGWSDADILSHSHVTTSSGQPTVAGLLAFGSYPQSCLPMSSLVASQWSGPSRQASSALLDSREFVGPISLILEQAVAWVARSTPTAIVERPDGHLADAPAYPARAVRELVANGLVHRDLGPYVASHTSLTLEPGQLIVSNAGGLFGLHVEALGKTVSHLRNPHLAALLLVARTTDGLRVIERLGTGIPRAVSALRDAGMPPPVFYDNGVRFTARLLARSQPVASPVTVPVHAAVATRSVAPTVNGETVLAALRSGSVTVLDLTAATGLSPRQVRYALVALQKAGHVTRFRQAHDHQDHFRLT